MFHQVPTTMNFLTPCPVYIVDCSESQTKLLVYFAVYTVNNESQHLIIYKVPKVNLSAEIRSECLKYGVLNNFHVLTNYKVESFTECYHAHFTKIQSARIAKRLLDNKSFYGEILHVCYAPEFETVAETREKLLQRQRDVLSRMQPGPTLLEYINNDSRHEVAQHRKRKQPALEITEERLQNTDPGDIWKDVPQELDPRIQTGTSTSTGFKKHFQVVENTQKSTVEYGPRLPPNIETTNNSKEESRNVSKPSPVRTTLIPTKVIKNYQQNYNKNIIFRDKNKAPSH